MQLSAATIVWDGGGENNNWSSARNWVGDNVPVANDSLVFDGFARLVPSNDFAPNTAFNGLTFAPTAGAFSLSGNQITLSGDIIDNTTVLTQTINLPLALDATRSVQVTSSGSLTMGGAISGTTFGLTKTGNGSLALAGSNSFGGPVTINGGIVSIAADTNLGAVPAIATPASLIIDSGTLRTATNVTVDAKRGMALGPSSGSGNGTINVVQSARIDIAAFTSGGYTGATTLTYGGVAANSSIGTGGLIKTGFGGLTLAGQNTYTGPTAVKVGTLRLDFSAASAPTANIIQPTSSLSLGGENAILTLGAQSFAALVVTGKDSTANLQTFNGTNIDVGTTYIRANSSASGSVNLNLGALSHNVGGVVTFIPPTSGSINTTTSNDASGILGGWATVATNLTPIQNNTVILSSTFASVDAIGNIVPYTGFTAYTAADNTNNVNLNSPTFAGKNVMIVGTAGHAATSVQVDAPNAGTVTDVNTISFSGMRNDQGNTAVPSDGVFIGDGNTLRLGRFGAIFRQDAALGVGNAQVNVFIGGPLDNPQQGQGSAGAQNVGKLTAGGADNTPGEIVLHVNNHNQTTGRMNVQAQIVDNGTGPVSVIKTGPGGIKINGHNTYSGGTYVIQGLIQLTGSEVGGSANPDGLGTGPVYIFPGGRVSLALGTNANDYYIAGVGTDAENFGALIAQNNSVHTGKLTLIGDARIARTGNAPGAFFEGQITDNGAGFTLNFGDGGSDASSVTLRNLTANPNDWTGTTLIGRGVLILDRDEQIPDGAGKGNVVFNGNAAGSGPTFDLNGRNETINGLSVTGASATNVFIENRATGTASTLSVGNYDQTTTFAGLIQDSAGTVALTKIGKGILTLSGPNTFTGETNINAGTLSITGAGAGLSTTGAVKVNTSATGAGTLSGTVAVGNVTLAASTGTQVAKIAPGPTGALGAIGTLTVSSLTMNGGDLQFDLITPGASDVIDVTGAASFAGASTISPGPIGAAGTYTLLVAAGGLTLGVAPTVNVPANTRSTFSLDTASTPNSIKLIVTGGPKNLTWTGATNNIWDVVNTTNWTDGVIAEKFFAGDSVTFSDVATNKNLNLAVSLLPGAITLNNTAGNDYSIAGGGSIDGSAGLTKAGTGRLIIATTNNYSGPTNISGGTVEVGAGGSSGSLGTGVVTNGGVLIFNRSDAFSSPNVIGGTGEVRKIGSGTLTLSGTSTYTGLTSITSGTVTVTNAAVEGSSLGDTTGGVVNIAAGAALDLAGSPTAQALNFGAKQFNIAGTGVGGTGVLTNSGAVSQFNTFQQVTLTADATVGGTGRFDIRGAGSSLNLAGFNLTKTGSNQFSLVDTTVTDGNIVVEQGNFAIEAGSIIPVSATGKTITYNNGTTAQFFNLAGGVARQVVLNGSVTMGNASGQGSVLNSNITLNGDLTVTNLNGSAGSLTLAGNITETGGPRTLTKTGGTTLTLQGTNAYSGVTNLNGGLVEFSALNNLGTNPAINFAGGGLLYGNGAGAIDASTRTLTFHGGGGTIDTNGNDVTFANPIGNNGTGGLTKAGLGTLTLTRANLYSGATSINGGTLLFSALNQLGTGTAVNFGGGTLRYANGVGSIDITTRAVVLNANGGTIDTNGNNVSFGNSIGGAGGLGKIGTGTLTLLAASGYSGPTTVSNGVLLVSGSLGATSNVNVEGGTLQLGATERLADVAAVNLGNGVLNTNGFSETLGALTLSGSATLELGVDASVVRFADSTVTFWFGDLSITNWSGSPGGSGTDRVFFGDNEFALAPEQLSAIRFVNPFGPGSGTFQARMLPTGEIVAIPEPNTLAALLVGSGGLLLRRRRAFLLP